MEGVPKLVMILNKNYETELNFKDLLFHVLYKWRLVLLIGLIVAGCFGFTEYWSFEKYHRNGELSPAEVQYVADVAANQKALEQAEKTLSEFEALTRDSQGKHEVSILMGIDPTNIWTAEKKYYLNIDNEQIDLNASSLSIISKKTLLTLAGAFSVKIDGDELERVFGTDLRKDIDQVAFIYVDTDLQTISVFGIGATMEEAIRRKELVDSYLHNAYNKLPEKARCSTDVIGDSVGIKSMLVTKKADGAIEEKDLTVLQNTIRSNYQTYQNQFNAYTQNRDALQSKTFTKPVPKTVSQALLGFLIGTFVAFLILAVGYLFNGKLKTKQELRNRYDLSLCGEFSHSRALWKGKGIDWILERLEFGKKTDWDNELNSIANLIDEAKDGKTILLTGSLEEKRLNKIYEGLAPKLQEKGIELIFEPDYLHNSEAVAASRDLDSVLLVEEKYKSRIRDLNRMAEMLTIEDANVIGAVLI